MRGYFALVSLIFVAAAALPQTADPALLAEIQQIKAIDNHSHPPIVLDAGQTDDDMDALPCDNHVEPVPTNTIGRPENPQFLAAWKALYGYKYDDRSPGHVAELLQAKRAVREREGDNFPNWVLDQLNIETELANRVSVGRGLRPPRFRWVSFVDALILPLNNTGVASETPDRKFFYGREEYLLKRYMSDVGVKSLPASLDAFTAQVVTPTLEKMKQTGAVAVKFEAAYLRALDFQPVAHAEAQRIYAQYAKQGVPSNADYKKVQDFLFHYIAAEAGRLGLSVHLHTGGGCGGYFKLGGSDPTLMDSVINDASLRKTNFVFIHGGAGPFTKQVAYQLMKPNVYADFSEQDWLLSTRKLSEVLRDWLEWYPEKVFFGTDLFPGTPEIDWEEIGWQTSQTGRGALAIALTGMMNDGEITRERARQLAHMVLHDNAAKFYGWSAAP